MVGDGYYVVDVKPKKQETDGFLVDTKFWVENMVFFDIKLEKTPKQNLKTNKKLEPTPIFLNGFDPTVSLGFLINTCVGILLGFQIVMAAGHWFWHVLPFQDGDWAGNFGEFSTCHAYLNYNHSNQNHCWLKGLELSQACTHWSWKSTTYCSAWHSHSL